MKNISVTMGICLLLLPFFSRSQNSEVFGDKNGAIKGYDPVAFFVVGKALKGAKEFSYEWNDATWRFASENNKNLFAANPEKYAPQYGGYCAYGTASGHKSPTETDTWTIVDNKLYFNYNQKVKTLWINDQTALIKKADEQWPKIKKE